MIKNVCTEHLYLTNIYKPHHNLIAKNIIVNKTTYYKLEYKIVYGKNHKIRIGVKMLKH